MKKNLYLDRVLWALLLLAGVFTMSACSDDDDDEPVNVEQSAVLGTWEMQQASLQMKVPGTAQKVTIDFRVVGGKTVPYLNGQRFDWDDMGIDPEDVEGLYARINFEAGNKFTAYEYREGKWSAEDGGTYSLKNNVLTFEYEEEDDESWKVSRLTADAMELEMTDFSDEEMAQVVEKATMTLRRIK